MKIRVHFDYEDIEATREQLIEYLNEEVGFEPDDLAAMTDEELCAAINGWIISGVTSELSRSFCNQR